MTIEAVCLCDVFPIKKRLGAAFAAKTNIRLVNPDEVSDPESIRHALAFRPGAEAFRPYPNLGLVCSPAAGIDGIAMHPALPAGIKVTRMLDPAQARMMAGFASYYVTGWHRRMWDYPARQADHRWDIINLALPETFTVGILGYGHIGSTVARLLSAMGYPVCAWAGRARQDGDIEVLAGDDGLKALAGRSQAIINMLPLTQATTGLLNADFFAAMGRDAILIHLGRGEHLVEEDLLAGLAAGRPARAAIDVLAPEPPAPDHPFFDHPAIMLTPHVASLSDAGSVAAWISTAIAQFDRGEEPQGLVDIAQGY